MRTRTRADDLLSAMKPVQTNFADTCAMGWLVDIPASGIVLFSSETYNFY